MARLLLLALLALASAVGAHAQFDDGYVNPISHKDMIDMHRKNQLHDNLMGSLQAQASRGNFKEMKVDQYHRNHVKEMLRGEIKPVRPSNGSHCLGT